MDQVSKLTLTISRKLLPKFSRLLEQGFMLQARAGCSIRDCICGALALDPAYLAERIQTIFLDHNPVDDINKAVIRPGSVLALSAAMPGLAGATLRKGGRFAALRKQISCQATAECSTEEKTAVTVKFFNMVADEQAETYFKRGIHLKGSHLTWFFGKYLANPGDGIQSAFADDKKIDPQTLSDMQWAEEVALKISVVQD